MENKINQQELIARLALASGRQKETCEAFINALTRVVAEQLEKGDSVRIKAFGTFKLTDIDQRKSVNVATGEEYEIPSHKRIVFVASKSLAQKANAHFEAFEAMELPDSIDPSLLDPEEAAEESALESEILLPPAPTVSDNSDSSNISDNSDSSDTSDSSDPSDNSDSSDPSDNSDSSDISDSSELSSDPAENPSRLRFLKGFLVGFVAAVAVIAGIVIAGFYLGWFNPSQGVPTAIQPIVVSEEPAPVPSQIIQVEDSLSKVVAEGDSLVPTLPSDSPAPKQEKKAEPVYDTVSTTRYLTTIAQQHYGNFNLWPIIYEENQAILGDPDRIKPGTRVVVPPLSKYGIDPSDPDQIKKIKAKGVAIYKKFRK